MATFGLSDEGYPDIDSDEFLELQMKAKFKLDNLIEGYQVIERKSERVNHAKTNERRQMLRAIFVASNVHKDEKGNGLIYWDKMLEFARMAVAEFNREDIQRGN